LSFGGTLELRDDWLRELDEKALYIAWRLVLPSLQPPGQQLGESPGNIARACVAPPSASGKERNFFIGKLSYQVAEAHSHNTIAAPANDRPEEPSLFVDPSGQTSHKPEAAGRRFICRRGLMPQSGAQFVQAAGQ
jgi:hypothetical protein